MKRIGAFVDTAHLIAGIQCSLLDAAESVLNDEERASVENAILSSPEGYNGWEGKLLSVLKNRCGCFFESIQTQRMDIPKHPQPAEQKPVVIQDKARPHLRRFLCPRCQKDFQSVSPYGLCCWGVPQCPQCDFQIHEPGCKEGPDAKRILPEKIP